MKKLFFLAALAVVGFASCTSDEYLGENSPNALQQTDGAINFGSGLNAVTRADFTGEAAAEKLNYKMKVYGVKQNRTTATNYDKVFVDYTIKYGTAKAGNDEYNDGWWYVGAEDGQVIKYWDYSSADYHFAAGSPVANFTYALNGTTGDIATATVTGLGGRLYRSVGVASDKDPVYVADPIVATKANSDYNNEVQFTFRALQAKVRVGIYETIPGYKITSITFYNTANSPSPYITLNSETAKYFQGGSDVTGVVTYNWATPEYTFEYTTGLDYRTFWEGGQFATGVPATNSANTNLYGADTQMASDGYFIVMPTASAIDAAPLTLKCDYTLTSIDGKSGETIKVTGATATIPSDYTKWEANKAYTYLFKITDNTNGTTGTTGDPVGLYPIVFDAVVVNVEDNKIGTETTVSTPSITCYQNGDVVTNGIQFVAGTDITIKVNETSVIEVKKLNGAFDYTKSYDAQDYSAAGATYNNVTEATLDGVVAATYVIKATSANGTAYFVLVVGAAEDGPANS